MPKRRKGREIAPGRGHQAPADEGAAPPATSAATVAQGGDQPLASGINQPETPREGGGDGLTVKELITGLPLSFASQPVVACRKPPGKAGLPIPLVSNFFEVRVPKGMLYHYDVEVYGHGPPKKDESIPEQKRQRCASTLVNRHVIQALAAKFRRELGNCLPAYDGRKNLYTRKKLPFSRHTFEVDIDDFGEQRIFTVIIAYAATISLDMIHEKYSSKPRVKDALTDPCQDAIQALDIILRTGPTIETIPVGRSFFTQPKDLAQCDLGGGRNVFYGFYTSLRLGHWKPMINIDMSATAFYQAGPLIDYICKFLGKDKRDLSAGLNDAARRTLIKDLRGLKLTATHLKSQVRYRIEDFTRGPSTKEEFTIEDKEQGTSKTITVAKYFQEKYNIRLQFPNLPCVKVGKKGNMYPLEVMSIAPGQHCRKKLNDVQTTNMIRKTAIPPEDRFRNIQEATQKVLNSAKPYLEEFSMEASLKPIEVTGRILDPPAVVSSKGPIKPVVNGAWGVENFVVPAEMNRWAVANLGNCRPPELDNLVKLLMQEGRKLGMKIAPPAYTNSYRNRTPRQVLEDVKNRVPDAQITVVILGSNTSYAKLKCEAETTDLCMRTQCVKDDKVARKFNGMFAQNLLQKINAKLGGRNAGIDKSVMPSTLKKPFMVVGADVNHPAPGDQVTPSVAAIVASMDSTPGQYYAVTSVQLKEEGNRLEYIQNTKEMIYECLTQFREKNKGILPQAIIYFRDGVSDTQFDAVRLYECGAVRAACVDIDPNFTPKVTFIVVQKRHHVRFRPKNPRQGTGKHKNIPPGTLVDEGVVSPTYFDFYLCPHFGQQGTSRPTHYHVVHDDAEHTPDEVYKICHLLSSTSARCARSVSLPAPVFYAHLAADRAKEHIKGAIFEGGSSGGSIAGASGSSGEAAVPLNRFSEAQKVIHGMRGLMYFV